MLSPWTKDDLKLKCEGCGLMSTEVSNHTFTHPYPEPTEYIALREKCFQKRKSNQDESAQTTDPVNVKPNVDIDLSTPEKCQETIQRIRNEEMEGHLSAADANVMVGAVRNALRCFR
jgi:hypothetical protein